jgi:hypothetical protein
MQGPSAFGIIAAQIVIISGPGGGEFIYNSTRTVLLYSNVGVATTDPVLGQAVPAGVTLFGISLQTKSGGNITTQITPGGNFFVFNSHGATIGLLSASNGVGAGLFIYTDTGTATQGGLIASVTTLAGVDSITGASYQAGITSYGNANAVGQLIGAVLQFFNAASTQAAKPNVSASGSATAGSQLSLDSGRGVSGASDASILLQSSDTPGLTVPFVQVTGDMATTGSIDIVGLKIVEGTNRRQGLATLVAGTVTINNNTVTANTRIHLTVQTAGGTQGFLRTTRVVGTSFTITSTSATETSTVAWMLTEPG